MPDTQPPSRTDQGQSYEPRHLPVPVAPNGPIPGDGSETWFGRILRALLGWKSASIRSDLRVLLEDSTPAETGFSPEESKMLRSILGLRERRVEDIMVPRADIVAVQREIPLGELVKVFENAAHSRLVVYDDTLDDPIGMVHIRDLIAFMTARATVGAEAKGRRKKPLPAGLDLKAVDLSLPLSAAKIIRTILFVPPSMSPIDLLAKMQATRIHLALVIDEYGGTDGLISIEDIVELIVGDIEDEHDEATEYRIVRQPDGSFVADARVNLEDVLATVGVDFDVGEATEEVDTLGGYLVARVGRLPVRGELVPGPGSFEIEVLDADPRRVKKVKIYRSRQSRLPRPREQPREPEEGAPASPRPAAAPTEGPAAELSSVPPVSTPDSSRQS